MASELLFDLSGIDLDTVAVTADEVGRLNPQIGDMRKLDHVIMLDTDAGHALGVKRVRGAVRQSGIASPGMVACERTVPWLFARKVGQSAGVGSWESGVGSRRDRVGDVRPL